MRYVKNEYLVLELRDRIAAQLNSSKQQVYDCTICVYILKTLQISAHQEGYISHSIFLLF